MKKLLLSLFGLFLCANILIGLNANHDQAMTHALSEGDVSVAAKVGSPYSGITIHAGDVNGSDKYTNAALDFTSASLEGKSVLAIDIENTGVTGGSDAYANVKVGINGNILNKYDNLFLTSEPSNVVEKKWGDWWFIAPSSRATVFLPTAEWLEGQTEIHQISFIFDNYAGNTKIFDVTLHGVYLLTANSVYGGTNLLPVLSNDESDAISDTKLALLNCTASYTTTAIKSNMSLDGSPKIHVKSTGEGGVADTGYSFLTIKPTTSDLLINSKNGFAFDVNTYAGECYIQMQLINTDGTMFQYSYVDWNNRGVLLTTPDGTVSHSIVHTLYGGLYIPANVKGTLYVPYSVFFTTPAGILREIKIGLDVQYGLGRSIALGNFVHVDATTTHKVYNMCTLSDLSESQWNRESLNLGTNFFCGETGNKFSDFAVSEYKYFDVYFLSQLNSGAFKATLNGETLDMNQVQVGSTNVRFYANSYFYYLYHTEFNPVGLAVSQVLALTSSDVKVNNDVILTDVSSGLILKDLAGENVKLTETPADLENALGFASQSLYSTDWRDANHSVCHYTSETVVLEEIINSYDQLSSGAKAMADLLDDSTEENPNVTLGQTMTMLKGYYASLQPSNKTTFSTNSFIVIWSLIAVATFCVLGIIFATKKAKKVR